MGIKLKASLLAHFNTSYTRPVRSYKLVIDGENLRYRVFTKDNLAIVHNTERALATKAVDMILRIRDRFRNAFRLPKEEELVVFMDSGNRFANKELRNGCRGTSVDMNLYRQEFIYKCQSMPGVITLVTTCLGEAEMNMYVHRDKSVDLNVFVTSDTDILAITYGHKAASDVDNVAWFNLTTSKLYDINDSCARFGYNVDTFLSIVAFSGTDYTPSYVTESMLELIYKFPVAIKAALNDLPTPVQKLAGLIYYCCTAPGAKCTLKRAEKLKTKDPRLMLNVRHMRRFCSQTNKVVSNFVAYNKTGVNAEEFNAADIPLKYFKYFMYVLCCKTMLSPYTFSKCRVYLSQCRLPHILNMLQVYEREKRFIPVLSPAPEHTVEAREVPTDATAKFVITQIYVGGFETGEYSASDSDDCENK